MKGMDILNALEGVKDNFVVSAGEFRQGKQARKAVPMKKIFLLAAVISLMFLLVGCAVVYVLRLQDMSIGQETYVQEFDESGKRIDPVEKERELVTFRGRSDAPLVKAMAEWAAFQESYDPDGKLMTDEANLGSIPDQYEYTYGCYTQEMVEKVNELADKYNLKLLDTYLLIQRYQADVFLQETGIGSLQREGGNYHIKHMSGVFYLPSNFKMEMDLSCDTYPGGITAAYYYCQKDYFYPAFSSPTGVDLNAVEQWDYQASDGSHLLLTLDAKGTGHIFSEQDDAIVDFVINGNLSGSQYPKPEEIITKKDMEQIADSFRYDVKPKNVDRADFEAKLQASEEAENAKQPEFPTYQGYSEYVESLIIREEPDVQYTYFDLNGDKKDELLISRDGLIDEALFLMDDGTVENRCMGQMFLCETGGVGDHVTFPDEDSEWYNFYEPAGGSYYDQACYPGNHIVQIIREGKNWEKCTDIGTEEPISQADAEAMIASYPSIQLDWYPIMDYTLDNGMTLGDYLRQKDEKLSGDSLLQKYRESISDDGHHTHYRIQDINGDGVEDLLLSGDGTRFWIAMTYRYGQVQPLFVSDFTFCQDGVLMSRDVRYMDPGVEAERYSFFRYDGFEKTTLALLWFHKDTATWTKTLYGEPISEAEAQAILAKYSEIDQGMKPLSELLG